MTPRCVKRARAKTRALLRYDPSDVGPVLKNFERTTSRKFDGLEAFLMDI